MAEQAQEMRRKPFVLRENLELFGFHQFNLKVLSKDGDCVDNIVEIDVDNFIHTSYSYYGLHYPGKLDYRIFFLRQD